MSGNLTLEDRISTVERDVAELRAAVFVPSSQQPWYIRMVGSMKDYPEFDEVARLGREFRKSDSPDSNCDQENA